ncbi:uncharacterized protein O9250_002771 [Rhynochetos jubatus]
MGMRSAGRCLGSGIPTLSTARALIVPGSSWPAQGSQGRKDADLSSGSGSPGDKIDKVYLMYLLYCPHGVLGVFDRGEGADGGKIVSARPGPCQGEPSLHMPAENSTFQARIRVSFPVAGSSEARAHIGFAGLGEEPTPLLRSEPGQAEALSGPSVPCPPSLSLSATPSPTSVRDAKLRQQPPNLEACHSLGELSLPAPWA